MACLLKLLVTLAATIVVASAEDYPAYDDDMCAVDDLAAILCDLCAVMVPDIPRDTCCVDADAIWQCEKIVLNYSDQIKNDYEATNDYDYNDVSQDYDYYNPTEENVVDKRAAWSYKKPTANRLNNAMYDLGFRGKRYSATGRFSWKPANYRIGGQLDPGFRGKRFLPQEYGETPYDVVNKRAYSSGYFNWKPTAYRLSDPYRFDRLGYMGKRSGEDNDVEKRARYMGGSYSWKPAPYRLDSDYMWDRFGKRGRYSYTPSSRFGWKPHSGRYDDYLMSKRSDTDLWWKPANKMFDDDRQMDKRFNIGLGRWNWKPKDSGSGKAMRGKRGRWDWKPTTGYYGYGLDLDSSMIPGKRPFAQFDWKPRSATYRKGEEKRSFSIRSWKPWRPASYRMSSDQLWG